MQVWTGSGGHPQLMVFVAVLRSLAGGCLIPVSASTVTRPSPGSLPVASMLLGLGLPWFIQGDFISSPFT